MQESGEPVQRREFERREAESERQGWGLGHDERAQADLGRSQPVFCGEVDGEAVEAGEGEESW